MDYTEFSDIVEKICKEGCDKCPLKVYYEISRINDGVVCSCPTWLSSGYKKKEVQQAAFKWLEKHPLFDSMNDFKITKEEVIQANKNGLKECPFCGKEAKFYVYKDIDKVDKGNPSVLGKIWCKNCNFTPGFGYFRIKIDIADNGDIIADYSERDKAITLWNLRA